MGIKKQKIFFINPMGYGTLGKYDYNVISNIKEGDLLYICNEKTNTEIYDIPVRKLYSYSSKKGGLKLASYLWSQLKLYLLLRSSPEAKAHFQWLKIPNIDLFLLKLLKKKGIQTILTVHNILPHDSGLKFRAVYSKIYRQVDIIIVHTSKTKDELCRDYQIKKSKIHVIPHGIFKIEGLDPSKIKAIQAGFIKTYNLENKVVFGLLGRISRYKGIDLVAETWQEFQDNNTLQLHLLVAGEGESGSLEQLRSMEHTSIIDRALSDEEFSALMQLSHYILLPYFKISQSGVLLTALSEKKKVIVSDEGGLTEPFKFGNIGYILKDLSKDELRTTCFKAASQKDYQPDEKIWQDIFDYYDWKNIGALTTDVYSV